MPIPGPRTQQRPLPGYTNPLHQTPDRINRWHRPAPVAEMAHTPGLMFVSWRGNVLGPGTIRRMWRQSINLIAAQDDFSWSTNGQKGRGYAPPVGVTRALRYMTRSVYAGSGIDSTRFSGLHTRIYPKVRSKPVTIGAGQVRTRPTVRNRITSFGSRVPTLNQPVQGAQPQ